MGEVQRRGASVYRSLVAPRGSSIVFKVETGQLRGCAGAHGARGVFGYREEGEWGKSERLRLVGGLLEGRGVVVEILTFLGSCSCPHVLALLPSTGTMGVIYAAPPSLHNQLGLSMCCPYTLVFLTQEITN